MCLRCGVGVNFPSISCQGNPQVPHRVLLCGTFCVFITPQFHMETLLNKFSVCFFPPAGYNHPDLMRVAQGREFQVRKREEEKFPSSAACENWREKTRGVIFTQLVRREGDARPSRVVAVVSPSNFLFFLSIRN